MNTKIIDIGGNQVTVYIEGNSNIPCMFVGAAGLFRKPNMLPEKLKETFCFYFVDLWDTGDRAFQGDQQNYKDLDWDKITGEIEEARLALDLDKIVIMGQSAAGAMPIEYARQYPSNCLLAIPIAFSPNWSKDSQQHTEDFMRLNASKDRKQLRNELQAASQADVNEMDQEKAFIKRFQTDRPLYWKDYNAAVPKISFMWQDYHPNVEKVIAYASKVLQGYDFFSNPVEDVPIFWGLGIYDYSAPMYLLTDKINNLHSDGKSCNIYYYLFDSGHYPMVEVPDEFADALLAQVGNLGIVRESREHYCNGSCFP